ncbi:MAG TPA: cytochrome bd-I oxidase subunit CydX [Vitreimonas sp.]|jgi:cyd operon protein YbgT|nr:cytochrome bd-I oxidase subunit CydX [Vitreimonas sp.]
MWYFSWILGIGLVLAFGILNALWNEFSEADGESLDSDTNEN